MPARSSYIQMTRSPTSMTWLPGVHRRVGGVAVPKLPDRGRALVDHVAPARVGAVRGQDVSQVRATVVSEHAHEPLAANQARADVVLGFVGDLVDEVVEDPLASVRRHQPEGQRQHAGGLRAVVVVALRGDRRTSALKAVFSRAARARKWLASSALPSIVGVARHQLEVVVEIGRAQAGALSVFRAGSFEWISFGSSGGTHQSP